MDIRKQIILMLSGILLNLSCFAQEGRLAVQFNRHSSPSNFEFKNNLKFEKKLFLADKLEWNKKKDFQSQYQSNTWDNLNLEVGVSSAMIVQANNNLKLTNQLQSEPFLKNRRNLYSSMWAFASLNYLYADLVGLMDANIHAQYEAGLVEGTKITPEFLSVAAVFMQIPISNVFLPHLIKDEKTLRWVQIASGTVMTLVQASTLFIGKPTPHYTVFSAFEIAATTFITIDAIKWKVKSKKERNEK
ncbi:DUF6326 family protein [Marivirga harenae]|uniref:DUF6326 family protein n=1 Tax=Marivirga harenae TaxID=2010992 RepID=UPI0026DED3B1|nr:DUF6326 family protein [Marivirga harenae]WKV10589.1 DUF6326 family protein [Marivirga harenae]